MAETETTDQSTEAPQEALSIESIAAEFNLNEQAPPQPKAEPQESKAPVADVPEDLTDPETLRKYLQSQAQQNAELRTSAQQLQAERERLAREQEGQEINTLVDKLSQEVGDVPKKLLRYALADRYESDDAFRRIFDGRKQTPQALEKAIKALVPEFRKEFSIKADPQIAETQRAMNEGTRGSSAPRSDEDALDARMLKAPNSEFDVMWRKLKGGF